MRQDSDTGPSKAGGHSTTGQNSSRESTQRGRTRRGRFSTAATYFFGALGGLLFGYDLGVVAGALLFLGPEFGLTPLQKGMVTSSLLVGAMLSALACGPLSDRFGRRPVVLASGLIFALGSVGAAFAPDANVVILARFVMGLAVGCASVMVPIYLSELAPARTRGALSGLNQLMISSGILVAYLVSLAFSPVGAWRWMFGVAAIPAVLLLIGVWFQPESPRWLVRHGREREARAVLDRRHERTDSVEEELAEIRRMDAPAAGSLSTLRLLRTPRYRKVLFLGCGLALLQQLVGINTIVYYAPSILTGIGFGNSAAILVNAGFGALTVAATVVMLGLVDRVGRRRPLIFGALGMTACMLALGGTFFLGGLQGGAQGWVAITALGLFKVCYSLSWGGIMWILLGEIFPLRVRGAATGLATFANWLGNCLVGLLFPTLRTLGAGTVFLLFAAVAVVAFVFAVRIVPETKGRSLEQIEAELVPAR